MSDRPVTRPHYRLHNTTTRLREGMSDLRVTLPHGGRGYVGPPCHTAPSSLTTRQREGMSDLRVTLPHAGRGYVGPPSHTAPSSRRLGVCVAPLPGLCAVLARTYGRQAYGHPPRGRARSELLGSSACTDSCRGAAFRTARGPSTQYWLWICLCVASKIRSAARMDRQAVNRQTVAPNDNHYNYKTICCFMLGLVTCYYRQ